MSEKLVESVFELSEGLNDLEFHTRKLEAIVAAVDDLVTDLDEVIHKGWHKEQTAQLVVERISRKLELIQMGFQPLNRKVKEKIASSIEDVEKLLQLVEEK